MIIFKGVAVKVKDSTLRQFMRFGLVGVSNTVVGYLLNIGTLFLLRPLYVSWDYIAGNLVSFVLGVLWVFGGNYVFVFKMEKSGCSWIKLLLKTYVTYAISGIFLTNLFSLIWIHIFHLSKYVAPALNLLITVPFNFVVNKFWTFKQRKG